MVAGRTDLRSKAEGVEAVVASVWRHPEYVEVTKGDDVAVLTLAQAVPYRTIALGEVEGFIKTVFDAKTGELLGAHMIGAEVTELIQGYTVGKTAELVETDFMHTVFPHPTLSEMMHESILAADGRVLHM